MHFRNLPPPQEGLSEHLAGSRGELLSYYTLTHPEFLNHHPAPSHSNLTKATMSISVKKGNMLCSSEVYHRKLRPGIQWLSDLG